MLNRRSLLLGALAAPAIVRAESLMRIWVPPREVWAGEWGTSILELTGERERQAMRNAAMREQTWVWVDRDLMVTTGEPARQAMRNAVMRERLAAMTGVETITRLEAAQAQMLRTRPRWVRA